MMNMVHLGDMVANVDAVAGGVAWLGGLSVVEGGEGAGARIKARGLPKLSASVTIAILMGTLQTESWTSCSSGAARNATPTTSTRASIACVGC